MLFFLLGAAVGFLGFLAWDGGQGRIHQERLPFARLTLGAGILASVAFVLIVIGGFGKTVTPGHWAYAVSRALSGTWAGQVALGMLFGLILYDWVWHFGYPPFHMPKFRRAHNYWAAVLGVLLLIGISIPYLPNIPLYFETINTPLGQVQIVRRQPILEPAKVKGASSKTAFAATPGPKVAIDALIRLPMRIELIAKEATRINYTIPQQHKSQKEFIEKVLGPLAECVGHAVEELHSIEVLQTTLRPVTQQFRRLLIRQPRQRNEEYTELISRVKKSYEIALRTLDHPKHPKNSGSDVYCHEDAYSDAQDKKSRQWPWTARQLGPPHQQNIWDPTKNRAFLHLALTYLLHFDGNVKGGIAILSNKLNILRKLGKGALLEEFWLNAYLANLHVELFLSEERHKDEFMKVLARVIRTADSLAKHAGKLYKKWVDNLGDKCQKYLRYDPKWDFRSRGWQNNFAYFAAETGLKEEKARKFAKENAGVDLSCFRTYPTQNGPEKYLGETQSDLNRANFLDTYGFVKMRFAERKVPFDEQDRVRLLNEVKDARNLFERAISVLAPLAKTDQEKVTNWTLEQRLLEKPGTVSQLRTARQHQSEALELLRQD